MHFRKTDPTDLPRLKGLWKLGFHDRDEDIDHFFEHAASRAIGFCAEEDGVLCAMLFALPQTLAAAGEMIACAYLYAVTTHPDFRGRGICKDLMAFAESQLKDSGICCTVLVPSEKSLFSFYASLGYQPQPANALSVCGAPKAQGEAMEVDPICYAGLRETILFDMPHVQYSAHWLRYQNTFSRFYQLEKGGSIGCAAVHASDAGALVYEILPDASFFSALAGTVHAEKWQLRTVGSEPFSMCKWLQAPPSGMKPIYLAFAFD